jgi:hypothetical protein
MSHFLNLIKKELELLDLERLGETLQKKLKLLIAKLYIIQQVEKIVIVNIKV